MPKDIEGFKALIEPMIMDGYLDTGEEIECMKQASTFGLSGQDAKDIMEGLCAKHGAKLETQLKKVFRESVAQMVDDKFLDDEEEEELIREGLNKFAEAEHPRKITLELIEEVVAREGAYTLKQMRADVVRKLGPYIASGDRNISAADWGAIKAQVTSMLERKGVDLEDNDIPLALERILQDNSMRVGSGSGGGNKTLYITVAAVFVLVVSLVVAALQGQGGPGPGPTPPGPSTAEVAQPAGCPTFDTRIPDLYRAFNEAVDKKYYTTPEAKSALKYGAELKAACSPLEEGLNPKQRAKCEAANDDWSYCDLDQDRVNLMESNYLRWSNDPSNPVSCQTWMKRCLALASGSPSCNKRMREPSCR